MKRFLAAITIIIILLSCTACGALPKKANGLQIICTVFPQYDWVMNILGEEAKNNTVTLLMDNGADLHNYQATAEDLMQISECDLFIYVGGASDSWVENALKNPANKERKTLRLLDTDPLCSDHEHHGEEEHEHEISECDEHIWLSLKRAEIISKKIAALLGEIDPDKKEIFEENAKNYCQKIHTLSKRYQEAVDRATHKTILVADRFPFLYLTDDLGISHHAAFSGCSTETQASFKTIDQLSKTLDQLKLPYILVTENSDQSVARSVIENSNQKNTEILSLHSIQSVTMKDIEDGESYLGLMEENLKILNQALGAKQ